MTQHFTSILSDRQVLRLADCQATFSAAPVAASRVIQNSTKGKMTITSLKGEDIGNATSTTLALTTNAASVSLSGYDITVNLNSSDTNVSNIATKTSDVKTLMEANSNIAALVSVTTNVDDVLTTKTKTFLTGGDDKLSITNDLPAVTVTRDSLGVFSVDFTDASLTLGDFVGPVVASVDGHTTSSGVAKVEVTRESADNTYQVRLYDYTGALTNPTAACDMHLVLAVSK